jgi:hypothetical protein
MTHELAKLLEQVENKELRNQLVETINGELQDAWNEGYNDGQLEGELNWHEDDSEDVNSDEDSEFNHLDLD